MSGNLIIPRVEVKWDNMNLTSYNGVGNLDYPTNEPLVYQVEAMLQAQSNGPTATMMWSPAGAAFKVYEYCITNLMDKELTTRFYYDNGKSITFKWVWCGQTIMYGNDMTVRVSLSSKLAGMANGTIRSVSISNSDKPANKLGAMEKLPKFYGIDPKLVTYSPCVGRDLAKATFNNYNAKDQSFGAAVAEFAGSNGNMVFAHNIDGEGLVLMCPYSYDTTQTVDDARLIPKNASPNPGQRYGYILGPSLISSIQRQVQWQPPQQSRTKNPAKTSRTVPKEGKENRGSNKASANPTPTTQTNKLNNTSTSAPAGSSTSVSITMSNANDPMVAKKKEALELESSSKLTFQTFMVPLLVGIKPHDIVYVPSLSGEFIEDWIVNDVSYNQTDGGVTVGISATRVYGNSELMNKEAGKKFQNIVKNNLKTLKDWDNYAWYNDNPSQSNNPATPASEPAPAPALAIPKTEAEQAVREFSATRTAAIG